MLFLVSSCAAKERETLAGEFLKQYYQVTEAQVFAFSELKDTESEDMFDQYMEKVKENYSKVLDTKEMERLAQNRILSYMIQYAYENNALYELSDFKLEIETDQKAYDLYNYRVDLLERASNTTVTLTGKLKIESGSNGDLITYAELGIPVKDSK